MFGCFLFLDITLAEGEALNNIGAGTWLTPCASILTIGDCILDITGVEGSEEPSVKPY